MESTRLAKYDEVVPKTGGSFTGKVTAREVSTRPTGELVNIAILERDESVTGVVLGSIVCRLKPLD